MNKTYIILLALNGILADKGLFAPEAISFNGSNGLSKAKATDDKGASLGKESISKKSADVPKEKPKSTAQAILDYFTKPIKPSNSKNKKPATETKDTKKAKETKNTKVQGAGPVIGSTDSKEKSESDSMSKSSSIGKSESKDSNSTALPVYSDGKPQKTASKDKKTPQTSPTLTPKEKEALKKQANDKDVKAVVTKEKTVEEILSSSTKDKKDDKDKKDRKADKKKDNKKEEKKKEEEAKKDKTKEKKNDKTETKNEKDKKKTDVSSVKTITVTEVRVVTVYKTMSTHLLPTIDLKLPTKVKTELFASMSPSNRTVIVSPASKDAETDEAIMETMKKEKKQELSTLEKRKENTLKKIEVLKEQLADLEKTIAVAQAQNVLHKQIVSDKKDTLDKAEKVFISTKKSSEKAINTTLDNLEKTKSTLDKSQTKKQEVEKDLKAAQKHEREINKAHANLKKEIQKVVKSIKEDHKKEISSAETQKHGLLNLLSKKSSSQSPDTSSAISASASKPEKRSLFSISRIKESIIPAASVAKASTPTTTKTPMATGSAAQAKPAQASNPQAAVPATSMDQPNIVAFGQNLSRGNLMLSGVPISKDPASIKKTQELFKKAMENAVKNSKVGDHVLAFWGYITSLLSQQTTVHH
ncbi:hypothetical protein NEOKW01_1986 [Nematocida sp. AWRm80]|nr:hypothetical protein NEOKW01_1986 [Nematocida sp. AWRm80]